MKIPTVFIYPSVDEIAEAFIKLIKAAFDDVASTDFLTLALSGGSTPAAIFSYIAKHHRSTIPWQRIKFFWGDERCVEPWDELSNYNMARVNLLEPLNIPEQNIFRVMGEYSPPDAAEHYISIIKENVRKVHQLPRFDIMLLGLGEDGHTASLFPGDDDALTSKDICVLALQPLTGQMRVSLTLPVINNSSRVVFIATGNAKARVVSEIIDQKDTELTYPASRVQPHDGSCTWLLDTSAATLMIND